MKFTIATIAAVAGLASAVPHSHQQFHKKDLLSSMVSDFSSFLGKVGVKMPLNEKANNGATWIGNDGPVVNTVMNNGSDPITFVVWGVQGSWVNAVVPKIAQVIQPGQNLTLSHAMGSGYTPNTGGWAAIHPDTTLLNGQIFNTWGEFSFTNDMYSSSTFDVSKEVNMNGHNMTIAGPKCVSDMNRCFFACKDKSVKQCGEAGEYELVNCATGSQQAASTGTFMGQASGGCQGIANTGVTHLITTIH